MFSLSMETDSPKQGGRHKLYLQPHDDSCKPEPRPSAQELYGHQTSLSPLFDSDLLPIVWTRVCHSCQLQSSAPKANTLPAVARFWWVLCKRKGRRRKLRGCRLENLRFSTQLQLSNPSSTVKSQTTRWELKTYTGLQGLIEEWFQLLTVL